jgi:hypothetical protein
MNTSAIRPWPTVATIGLTAFAIIITFGFTVHHKGYGTGPSGIVEMLQGIGIGLIGCLISFICGIISFARVERFLVLGFLAVSFPIVLIVLSVAKVIPV